MKRCMTDLNLTPKFKYIMLLCCQIQDIFSIYIPTGPRHWSFQIMIQTLFVRNKHIIIRIIHFLNRNFFIVCNLLLWVFFVNLIWFCVPCALFAGQKSYVFYLVVLTLVVRVVLLSSEGSEVSVTDSLS